MNVLTEAVDNYLPQQLSEKFAFNIVVVSAGMTAAVAVALIVTSIVVVQQLVHAAQTPHIKLRSKNSRPSLMLADGTTWHLFLSQCAHAIRIGLSPPLG